MMYKRILLLFALFLLLTNAHAQYCTNTARYTEVQFFDSTQLSVGSNIQYGTANNYQGNPQPLRMDIYYPNLTMDTSAKRPFIMMFHGGGFSSGDKQSGDIRDLCIHLALRGFVCATVGYRLGHDFSEYGQYKARYRAIQDGHAAMRYIVNNANTLRIDTGWLFVGGQSAGSLIALGMVYADQSELDSISLLYNSTAASVELGNLNTSGNTLTNTYTIKGVFNNWGGVVKTEMDPDEMIPTIAFHGAVDSVVRIDADPSFSHYTLNGSRAIHNELVAKGVCSEITVDTLGEHGIFRNASSVFRAQRASCFFKSVFCKKCTNFYTTDSVPSNCSTILNSTPFYEGSTTQIYPNPFNRSFQIDGIEGLFELHIYNCFGQLVYKGEHTSGKVELDVPPGVYFLNIRQVETNEVITRKLIKN